MKIVIVFLGVVFFTACDLLPANNGLNRNASFIHYSKHARCRMECRHITENEIKNVLQHGIINYNKSELNKDDCHKRYAVEENIQNTKLRVVFACCGNEVTVITCIDLEKEWSCACPGDK